MKGFFVFRTLLILKILLLPHSVSYVFASGADSSGGGMELGDRLNPWFLENKETISYCIDVNESSFSQDTPKLRTLIERAFFYWTNQISLAQRWGYSHRLATQKVFYLENCSRDVDVRFAFGTPDGEVKKWLKDPREYIGIAVRTSYDSTSLTGKGFVYISPDHKELWAKDDGVRLYWLLAHEIGHVFGMQHFGSLKDVMGANFPEWLVRASGDEQENLPDHRDTLVFDYRVPRLRCGYKSYDLRNGLDYLRIKRDCIKIDFQSVKKFSIFESDSANGPWHEVGHFTGKSQWRTLESAAAVMLYLQGQNWLRNLPTGHSTWQAVIGITRLGAEGTLDFVGGQQSRPLRIDLAPNHLSISGIENGSFSSHLLDVHWPD